MFVKLCDKSVLPLGELKAFKIKGHEILAANIDGKIFCLDGRCTHAGAPLAEGSLNGEVLTCPWHYSQFSITNGTVLGGPAYKPLKNYLVEEREDSVFIDFKRERGLFFLLEFYAAFIADVLPVAFF